MNTLSIATQTSYTPQLFANVVVQLEERKNFGDRRRYPDIDHPHGHPLTNRRESAERRQNFLNEEIFNR